MKELHLIFLSSQALKNNSAVLGPVGSYLAVGQVAVAIPDVVAVDLGFPADLDPGRCDHH